MDKKNAPEKTLATTRPAGLAMPSSTMVGARMMSVTTVIVMARQIFCIIGPKRSTLSSAVTLRRPIRISGKI
jgi:hypothetical protein